MKLFAKISPSGAPAGVNCVRVESAACGEGVPENGQLKTEKGSLRQGVPSYQNKLQRRAGNHQSLRNLSELSSLNPKLLTISELVQVEEQHEIDWGFTVGIFNPTKLKQEVAQNKYLTVRIGPSQEINSLTALRKYSLDRLIVYYPEQSLCSLLALLKSSQRIMMVIHSWEDVLRVSQAIENTLLQSEGQQTVQRFADKLLVRLIKYKSRYVMQFMEAKEFYRVFANVMEENFQDLKGFNPLQPLAKVLTIQDYYQSKLCNCNYPSLQKKIKQFKFNRDQDLNLSKKLEQILTITLVLDTKSHQEEQSSSQLPQNISADDSDQQIQYFRAQQSQVETKETGTRPAQIEDLYYFIEEHDSSSSDEKKKHAARYSNTQAAKPLGFSRRKSQGSVAVGVPQELDDQFFTKY